MYQRTWQFVLGLIIFCAALEVSALDTDIDGLSDDWEVVYGFDPYLSNNALEDPDGDGITNIEEFNNELDPWHSNLMIDSDSDGLSDIEEVHHYGTHPTVPDSDFDGMPDSFEVSYGLSPLSRGDMYLDKDGDGSANIDEYLRGTNPSVVDTDGDSFNDGVDQMPLNASERVDTDGDSIGNNADMDDDNDSISDTRENSYCRYGVFRLYCTDPLKADTDGDTIPDAVEIANGTNPVGNKSFLGVSGDMDRDGMQDDWEKLYGVSDAAADEDGDALKNLQEFQQKLNPRLADTDGDGHTDSWELSQGYLPASAEDTLHVVMATGQSLAVGGGLNIEFPDPYDPNSHRVVSKIPNFANCPQGRCLMLNTGTRGVEVSDVNTPDFPLQYFSDIFEGSASFGPYQCDGTAHENVCNPKETQGVGLLAKLYKLSLSKKERYLFRTHGASGQAYDPFTDPLFHIAFDPDVRMGLKKGTQVFQNAFGPVNLSSGQLVSGELDSIIAIAKDPTKTPFPSGMPARSSEVVVDAVVITHGETDRALNNAHYDKDLQEWVADYASAIKQKTSQTFSPVFLVDQLGAMPSSQGSKISLDQWRVSEKVSGVFLTTAKYFLPLLSDKIHMTAEGYYLLGEYHAKALSAIRSKGKWSPLHPVAMRVNGSGIDVDFYLPEGGHLVLDTAICNRMEVAASGVGYENLYGFSFHEGENGELDSARKVQAVSVVDSDTIRVTLTSAPDPAGWPHLQYAYDADDGSVCGSVRDEVAGQVVTDLPVTAEHHGWILNNWSIIFSLTTDADVDSMPDGWEFKYGLNYLLASDAVTDADADGLSNLDEYLAGTNPRMVDTDGDGLTDFYELKSTFTNPLLVDSDGDGLSDYQELYVTSTLPLNPDTDGDGMPDGFEVLYGLNPLASADSVIDSDGDGLLNLQEYLSGSDPTSRENATWPLSGHYVGSSLRKSVM